MKRILSAILVLVMVLSCFPLTALATENGETTRYSVLILDTSGSMSGTPAAKQKAAAIKFCESVLKADGKNYVAIVKLNTNSTVGCSFTDNLETLTTYINGIPASGGTNINEALEVAGGLLQNVGNDAIKNIILCSDGLPESGTTSSTGPYTDSNYSNYKYANTCYNTAAALKQSYNLYTLGFFHSLSGSNLIFGRRFMNDLQNAGYYEVTDPEQLEFSFGEIADDITQSDELKKITFRYQSGKDYSATCYYTDEYFADGSYTYNQSLATMTLAFAMSAFGSGDEESYENKSINAQNLLKEIGMDAESIQVNDWFTVKPTTDSIGVIAGNKSIHVDGEDYTLVALAVRGKGYEQEWASNFTIGTSGQHEGFDTAKNNVIAFLRQYLADQHITGKVKFWITGFSCAAATANLVGGALDHDTFLSSDITYDYDDIYTYCFEAPAGARTSQVKNVTRYFEDEENKVCCPIYNNIFNIINASDPVPYVAPAAMGFCRYGVDRYLPSAQSDSNYARYDQNGNLTGGKLYEMLKVYDALQNTESYLVDDFQMKKLTFNVDVSLSDGVNVSLVEDDLKNNYSQGVFLSNYVTILAKEFIGNRANYVKTYEDEIREICAVMFGCTDAQSDVLVASLVAQAKNNWGDLVGSYIWNVGIKPFGTEDDALQVVSDWLKQAIQDAGITDYDAAVIDRAGKDLADLLLALVANHPNYATTAVENIKSLGAAHYPELCFAWMASMDENYSNRATTSFNNGSYRVIRINCDVDVSVFDKAGQKVAGIVNELPQDLQESGIISAINDNGEKIIILPVDTAYRIEITGRADGTVNYGIDEYCALAGDITRAVNYFQISLLTGETLTGWLPAYSAAELESDTPNGSTAAYTLYAPNGALLPQDSDLTGTDATEAYYDVAATASNAAFGIATGSGVYQYGKFAKVEAFAKDGYTFVGWYDGWNCVSEDAAYRFCVTEDVKLTAIFRSTSASGYDLSGLISAPGSEPVYDDVDPHAYYYDALCWAVKHGITTGTSADRFSPEDSCTRAQAVTFLWRAAGSPAPTGEDMPFADVPADAYYRDAVLWAVEQGIAQGTGADTFSPDENCTRSQIVTFLWRWQRAPAASAANPFADVPEDAYYRDAVLWAVEAGITVGTTGDTFSPDDNCSRAQIVTFLYRNCR